MVGGALILGGLTGLVGCDQLKNTSALEANINDDPYKDRIVLEHHGTSTYSITRVSIAFGNKDGSYLPNHELFRVEGKVREPVLSDLNENGKLDFRFTRWNPFRNELEQHWAENLGDGYLKYHGKQ